MYPGFQGGVHMSYASVDFVCSIVGQEIADLIMNAKRYMYLSNFHSRLFFLQVLSHPWLIPAIKHVFVLIRLSRTFILVNSESFEISEVHFLLFPIVYDLPVVNLAFQLCQLFSFSFLS